MRRFLARFRIADKFLVVSAVLSAPGVVLLAVLVSQLNGEIRSTREEIEATRRLEPLAGIAEGLDRHQRLSYARLAGDLRGEALREEAARRLDEAFPRSAPGPAARWQELRTSPPADPEENHAAHQRLSLDVWKLTQEAGSALVLDAHADSYHVAQLAVDLIPRAWDTISDSILLAYRTALDPQAAAAATAQLQLCADVLDRLLFLTRQTAETGLQANAAHSGASASLQQSLPAALARFEKDVGSYVKAMRVARNPGDLPALGERAADAAGQLWYTNIEQLRILLEKRLSDLGWRRAFIVALTLLAFVLAGAIQSVVLSSVTRPLPEIVKLSADVASGRLKAARERLNTGSVRRMLGFAGASDETYRLVRAIADMTTSLDVLLTTVRGAGSEVASSASRIAGGVRQLEAVAAQQASAANEVNATTSEILGNLLELTRTMEQLNRVASDGAESAAAGVTSLAQIHSTIQSLLTAGAALASTLKTVADKAGNVDQIVGTITKIANRTNLLSLNAAIEAERGGESAGGLSIVALEVRKLADQTAVAALDIEALVRDMQGAVREGMAGVERYTTEMRDSSGAVDALGSGLERVIEGSRRLGPDFEAVNEGMKLQSQGASQIARSMAELREAAQQTRDSLAEFRQVAEQLGEAMSGLQSEMGRFS